jgi:hypothetical protein
MFSGPSTTEVEQGKVGRAGSFLMAAIGLWGPGWVACQRNPQLRHPSNVRNRLPLVVNPLQPQDEALRAFYSLFQGFWQASMIAGSSMIVGLDLCSIHSTSGKSRLNI